MEGFFLIICTFYLKLEKLISTSFWFN